MAPSVTVVRSVRLALSFLFTVFLLGTLNHILPSSPRTAKLRPHLLFKRPTSRRSDFLRLPDGRLLITQADVDAKKEHPIFGLMREAEGKWEALKKRQSRTFEDAVSEYVRRYGRKPPKGFDRWYRWARERNVTMIDEYDLIDRHIRPWRAFSPSSLLTRQNHILSTRRDVFHFSVSPVTRSSSEGSGLNGYLDPPERYFKGERMRTRRKGPERDHARAKWVERAVADFVDLLEPVEMVFALRDVPQILLPWAERQYLERKAALGAYVDDDNGRNLDSFTPPIDPLYVQSMCPPDSPAVRDAHLYPSPSPQHPLPLPFAPLPDSSLASFIHDPSSHMDPCLSPHMQHFHASTSWYYPRQSLMLPYWVPGTWGGLGDVGTVMVEHGEWKNWDRHLDGGKPWELRKENKAYWRGQTSGNIWSMHRPWHASHRARLHTLSNWTTGSQALLQTGAKDSLEVQDVLWSETNGHVVDAGMTGPPVQCEVKDGACEQMYEDFGGFLPRDPPDRADDFRYLIDIDGNSWSGRFRQQMLSHAVVLKTTIFQEFWQATAIPWLHYVPISTDLSDLHNVLAFFAGRKGEGGHEREARRIAEAGREYALNHLRLEDFEAYEFRLMLEWARLLNPKPEEADFMG